MTEKNPGGSPRSESNVTDEVADEGGSPGDLELERTEVGTGSEAGEQWRPAEERQTEVRRDSTGPGRRSPS